MPELPEAETIVRGLRPAVTGSRIRRTSVQHEDVLEASAGRLARALGDSLTVYLSGYAIAVAVGMPARVVGRRRDPADPVSPTSDG